MLKLCVRYCSAMLLDLCPNVLSRRNTKDLCGFWRAMFYPFGGHMQGWKQHFGPRSMPSWPSWTPLRCLEATAMLLGAKLGDLEGKLGHREVMLKLSWAMLCRSYRSDFLRPCCWLCIPKCFPPSRTKILSVFL